MLVSMTGSFVVSFHSHHVTNTLTPDVVNSASINSVPVVLLRLIMSTNVGHLSIDALKITSLFPVLLEDHTV